MPVLDLFREITSRQPEWPPARRSGGRVRNGGNYVRFRSPKQNKQPNKYHVSGIFLGWAKVTGHSFSISQQAVCSVVEVRICSFYLFEGMGSFSLFGTPIARLDRDILNT